MTIFADDSDPGVEIVWTTRDGRMLRLEQITDRHMANIIGMLEASGNAALACGFQGEEASYAADQHFDRCSEQALFFRAELERRQKTVFA